MERMMDGVNGKRVRDELCKEKGNSSVICGVANLPNEIIFNILSLIPVDSLFRFRGVCKLWYTLIYDPYFLEMHSKASEPRLLLISHPHLSEMKATRGDLFLIDEAKKGEKKARKIPMDYVKGSEARLHIVGSCNGFICIATIFPEDPIFICNPITGECIELPTADPSFGYDDHAVGFSFNHSTKQYKVVRLCKRFIGDIEYADFEIVAEMFTLGTQSWKVFEIPYPLLSPFFLETVCIDGDLHWPIDRGNNHDRFRILVYGIGNDEMFKMVAFPSTGPSDLSIDNVTLKNLKGRLALVSYVDEVLDIWLLMDKEKGIWSHHAIDLNFMWNVYSDVKLIGLSKKFGLLLEAHNYKSRESHLILFNHGNNTMTYVQVSGIPSMFSASLFVPTLDSLSAICGKL